MQIGVDLLNVCMKLIAESFWIRVREKNLIKSFSVIESPLLEDLWNKVFYKSHQKLNIVSVTHLFVKFNPLICLYKDSSVHIQNILFPLHFLLSIFLFHHKFHMELTLFKTKIKLLCRFSISHAFRIRCDVYIICICQSYSYRHKRSKNCMERHELDDMEIC